MGKAQKRWVNIGGCKDSNRNLWKFFKEVEKTIALVNCLALFCW